MSEPVVGVFLLKVAGLVIGLGATVLLCWKERRGL